MPVAQVRGEDADAFDRIDDAASGDADAKHAARRDADFKTEAFGGVSRDKFLEALRAEGVPCSGGYGPANKDGLIEEALASRGYQRLFSKERLERYRRENTLPQNDQLCREAVWLTQNMLLGTRQDMDDIADAVEKIYLNRGKLT